MAVEESKLVVTKFTASKKALVLLASMLLFLCSLSLNRPVLAFDGEFGMDEEYNNSLGAAAANSTANAGTQAYSTDSSAWQDMTYVINQYAPYGNVQAPLQSSPNGAISTFKGTTGDKINKPNLPKSRAGLMAVRGGYVRPACGIAGTGGFYGMGISRKYPLLPPTATTPVDLHITY